jgi:CspA family cold shock protein
MPLLQRDSVLWAKLVRLDFSKGEKMINSGKTKFNWTKLAIALALMCSLFGFSPMAHTKQEGPLNAEAVSALIEELTDGLQDVIEDEDQVAAITEKWDAHEDLVGKTRAQILKLLFEDVKSVIKDKETLDDIWASWGSEEESKDETPVKTPAPAPPPTQAPTPPPAPPQAKAPPKPAEQSPCQARAALFFESNQAERFRVIRAGYGSLVPATGTVRCYDEKRGFGFITADGDGADVFVHFTSINMDGHRTLQEGQKVQFEVQIGSKGQRIAVNVRAA